MLVENELSERVGVSLGRNVRALRLAKRWSQEELGRQMAAYGIDMHQTTVAKLENAGRPTTVAELVALGRIFRIGAARLLSSKSPDGTEGYEPETADEADLRRLEEAMAAVRETYNQSRQIQRQIEELQGRAQDVRREHSARVQVYNAARKKVGPEAPQLPIYIENAGKRAKKPKREAAVALEPVEIDAVERERDVIVALARFGFGTDRIGEILNLPVAHIRATLNDRRGKLSVAETEEQKVVRLLLDGLTDEEIAEQLGLSEERVRDYVRRILPYLSPENARKVEARG